MLSVFFLGVVTQPIHAFGGGGIGDVEQCTYENLQGSDQAKKLTELPKLDVAVVGGGISGAYTSWRLLNDNPSLKVSLFERTDRIGGRLYSPSIGCETDDASEEGHLPRCELGGMRVRFPTDNILLGIAEELGLEMGDFYLNSESAEPVDDPTNPTWLRGETFARADVDAMTASGDTSSLPYEFSEFDPLLSLTDHKHGQRYLYGSPTLSFYNVSTLSAEGYSPCNTDNYKILEQDLASAEHTVILKAYQWSVGAASSLISDTSPEGTAFSYDYGGYHFDENTAGLTNTQEGPEFLPSGLNNVEKYVRPLMGMQEFPLAIQRAFEGAGGATHMDMELKAISYLGEGHKKGKYRLHFRATRTHPCTEVTDYVPDAAQVQVYADKLVLAGLPMAMLDNLITSMRQEKMLATVKTLIKSVALVSAGKFFFALDDPPAPRKGESEDTYDFSTGRFTSSTEIQQLFAWYPGTQARPDQTLSSCTQTVLQMYSADTLWETIAAQPEWYNCSWSIGPDQCDQCQAAQKGLLSLNPKDHFPKMIADYFLNLLSTTYLQPKHSFKLTANKIRYFSPENPSTQMEGWHHWKADVKWWDMFDLALQPEQNVPLYIVGEAFSTQQGWANGAVLTAEYMLQEKMGLARPAWLTKDQYCADNPYYPKKRANN